LILRCVSQALRDSSVPTRAATFGIPGAAATEQKWIDSAISESKRLSAASTQGATLMNGLTVEFSIKDV
jgi:hypothetical protein